MESNSDTESESGNYPPPPTVSVDSNPVPFTSPIITAAKETQQEIDRLLTLDCQTNTAPFNTSLLDAQQSANILISFVSELPNILETDARESFLTFAALVHDSFLRLLFIFRQQFRRVAVNGKTGHMASVIVTWVDELLAKVYGVLLIVVSRSISIQDEYFSTTENIRLQKRDDVLRAVLQLPEKWIDVHRVIGSVDFSPAAKRAATFFLFATHVFSPQILPAKSWPEVMSAPKDILTSLHLAAGRIVSELSSPSMTINYTLRRMEAAVLISLLSVLDHKVARRGESMGSPVLRPEGYSHLLDLIKLVMDQPVDSYMPVENLDVAQMILLRWGNVIPWSLSTWDDLRIANTECLFALTATWLCHLDIPSSCGSSFVSNDIDSCMNNKRLSLFLDINSSYVVVLQLLQSVVRDLTTTENSIHPRYSMLVQLSDKLFCIIVHYLESNMLKTNFTLDALLPEYAKSTLAIYSLLGTSEDDLAVKRLTVEALSLIPSEILSVSIHEILKSYKFVPKLERAIRVSIGTLPNYAKPAYNQLELRSAKILAEFLTILSIHSSADDSMSIQNASKPFFTILFKALKMQNEFSSPIMALRIPLLLFLCASRPPTIWKEISDEDVWSLAVYCGSSDMITAGLFSQYIMCTGRMCNALLVCEAWDYLLSILITIIDREILLEAEPLALLTVTIICCALYELLHGSKASNRRRILSSPWTSTMKVLIQNAASGISNTKLESYFDSLNQRLLHIRDKLLREIEGDEKSDIQIPISERTPLKETSEIKQSTRLIYFRDMSYSGLLYVCDISVSDIIPG